MDFYIQTFITTLKSISRVIDLFQTPDKWQMRFLEFPEKNIDQVVDPFIIFTLS